MAETFLIGDTHFGHKKIITFEPEYRPFATIEEHDEELVRRWNNVVRPQDTVWHLGDVLFGTHSFVYLGRLNGHKKLVAGNHDQYPTAKYLEHFKCVVGAAEVAHHILTHVPVHPSQFSRFDGNIHGHLHRHSLDDSRYINVSAERINLTPIALNVAIANRGNA